MIRASILGRVAWRNPFASRRMVMLKGVPANISPDLMKAMMEMGHGDEIVIADGNFPAASCAQRLIRADGDSCTSLLKSMMRFMPLDKYDKNAMVMELVPDDAKRLGEPPIWADFKQIISEHESDATLTPVERFAFYERAKKAFAVVATSETAIYANLILKKGVVTEPQ
eukprot:TRINITY_DN95924_c0_g1_i1.p1 TRINITY_DN95924_c0_g1~~TRINITY_DN95924_c0_g1_i1.p1  ORF type:complete len:169 (+),score=5.70 TRINITY_DN95924_c0_g1_i1:25-531(+)